MLVSHFRNFGLDRLVVLVLLCAFSVFEILLHALDELCKNFHNIENCQLLFHRSGSGFPSSLEREKLDCQLDRLQMVKQVTRRLSLHYRNFQSYGKTFHLKFSSFKFELLWSKRPRLMVNILKDQGY